MQRKIKNVVKNYTASEIKVREATSNDPWGPSHTLMSEISTLTFDPLAFGEMMNIIWKRLNDHGKNWRHVYKSLVLLDFLVRTGSEKVVKQCRDNIIFIQTLRDFQYVENGLDCGLNVREASKKLYDLLRDEDRLKNERHRANKSKSKFGDFRNFQSSAGDLQMNSNGYSLAQSSSTSSSSFGTERKYRPFTTDEMERELHRTTTSTTAGATGSGGDRLRSSRQVVAKDPEIESIRPSNQNEEEIQLQLALAMSKEQHEQEMKKIKSEEIKLQMAIEESKKTAEKEKLWHHPLNYILEDQHPLSSSSRLPYAPPSSPPPSSSSLLAQALIDPWSSSNIDPWKMEKPSTENPAVSKNTNSAVQDLFAASGDFYSTVDKPSSHNNSNITMNDDLSTRPKYPWETMGPPTKSTVERKATDEFSELLNRAPPVASKSPQQFNNNNNVGSNIGNNSSNSIDNWFNGNASNDIQQISADKTNVNNNNAMSDSIEDLLNLNLSSSTSSQQKATKNTKKVTPEEFLGPNAKLVDFDELISKPNPAKTVNPFAITTANKGAPQNPFTVKAQQEAKSNRVPLNQLQAGNLAVADQSASSFRFDNSTYSQPQEQMNLNAATNQALTNFTQPAVQNQTYNPFL